MLNVFPTLTFLPANADYPKPSFRASIQMTSGLVVVAHDESLAVAKARLTERLKGAYVHELYPNPIVRDSEVPLACAIQPELRESTK